jgi:hypothetical protein
MSEGAHKGRKHDVGAPSAKNQPRARISGGLDFLVMAMAWALGILTLVVIGAIGFEAIQLSHGKKLRTAAEAPMLCPPIVSAPPPRAGAPVGDVIGVRLGYSVEDAQKTLLCRSKAFKFTFAPMWHTRLQRPAGQRQRMVATRAQEVLTFGLVGPPEHEIVRALWHDMVYPLNVPSPKPQALVADLVKHYGVPHEQKAENGRIDLWWAYNTQFQPVKRLRTPSENPIAAFSDWVSGSLGLGACKSHVSLDPLEPAGWSGDCGVTIHAEIDLSEKDPQRVTRYRIVSVDQAALAASVLKERQRLGLSPG